MEVSRPSGRPPLPAGELSRRKRVILEATLGLVAAEGAATVRLRDVARASGVSVGSLQYYFDSRDQLIREAFDQHARDVVELVALAGDASAPPPTRLAAVIEAAVLRPDLRQSAALWMEFVTAGLHDDELRALLAGAYEAWRELLAEVVRSGTETGDFRPLLPARPWWRAWSRSSTASSSRSRSTWPTRPRPPSPTRSRTRRRPCSTASAPRGPASLARWPC